MLARLAQGSPDAFDEVYRHYWRYVAAIGLRLLGDDSELDDLVQETFLAAWQNLPSYRGESSVRSWLLGIARHKVEDYYRRRLQECELPEDGAEPSAIPFIEDRLEGVGVAA